MEMRSVLRGVAFFSLMQASCLGGFKSEAQQGGLMNGS